MHLCCGATYHNPMLSYIAPRPTQSSQTFREDTFLIMDATIETLRLVDKVAQILALSLAEALAMWIMQAVEVCILGVLVIDRLLHSASGGHRK